MTDQAVPMARRGARWRMLQELPLLVTLVLLWMLLWGEFSLLNLLFGALFAFVVTRIFYLPPVQLSGRFNLLWFAAYLGRTAYSIAIASFQVSWLAIDWRRKPVSSIVAVQLRTRSDFITTLVSITISIIPGSLVVDTDRSRSILYLHVLDTNTDEDNRAMRRQVLRIEKALVRALGSKDDIRRTVG
jgi:multicomponent Na+:H+ antiporter subunit E